MKQQTHPITAPAAASSPHPVAPHNQANTDERHWTPQKQAEFLRALAATHCVTTAARSVGMARQSAYRLRNRLKGEPFDYAWQCAFRRQYDALADAALERALNGVEVPHYHKGELVGTHRVYSEGLTVALLKLKARLTAVERSRFAETDMFDPDGFEELLERVATGDELWAEMEPEDGEDSIEEA